MSGEVDAVIQDLRRDPRIRRVELVPLGSRREIWVTFREGLEKKKLFEVAERRGYLVVRFGGLPSRLPRGIAEIIWNGVTHVIRESHTLLDALLGAVGIEPPGIAKVALNLHDGSEMYVTATQEGLAILYEYLGRAPPKPLS